MRRQHTVCVLLSLAALAASAPRLAADFPIVSHRFLADPAPLVTADRVYFFASNDDESPVEGSYNIPNVICVSSSDMKNWTDHGSVFRPLYSTTWARRSWAPAAVERDGKFFLYFGNGGANIGVAVSTRPTGPFKCALGRPLIEHHTPGVQPATNMWLFDPCVFIDDCGQAYIYFGGNGDDNVRIARLNRDMISLDGEVMRMVAPNFFEASWVHKRNGIYYFSYSTNPRDGMRFAYMTSNNPTSGFTFRGIVSDQPPYNHNNHHAANFEFKGRWFHVYHNRIVATRAGIPTGYRRNLAVEELHHNEDGTIRKVTFTTNGVAQIGRLNPFVRVEGETFNGQHGVETEPCAEGGMNLTDLHHGDWVRVYGVDFGANGPTRFNARVASGRQGGSIELRLGGPDGRLIGTCRVENTRHWQSWRTVTTEVSGTTGVHNLYLRFTGGDGPLMNLNYWEFD